MSHFTEIVGLLIKRSIFIIVLIGLGLFMVSCGGIISTLIPFDNLPTPSGSYKVGTRIYTWVDSSRDEWFTEMPEDYRKIVVQVWYPARSVSGMPIPYLDQWQRRIGPIAKQIELPKMLIHSIKHVQSNSYLDAEIDNNDRIYPLIIFSHGLGGMRMQNTIQMEALASEGYIALAIDHAYDANITLFDDGGAADYRSGAEGELNAQEFWALRIPQINTRAEDVSFVLNHIGNLQEEKDSFWQSIDLDRIGIMGHSFGGATSIVASSKDKRLNACINLDGWMVPVESSIIQSGMKIPFLYMGRPKWETELNYLKLDSLISVSTAPSEKLILPGTKHFDYSDTPQFSPMARKVGVAGKMSAEAIRDTLNTRILHFFATYLVEDKQTK